MAEEVLEAFSVITMGENIGCMSFYSGKMNRVCFCDSLLKIKFLFFFIYEMT